MKGTRTFIGIITLQVVLTCCLPTGARSQESGRVDVTVFYCLGCGSGSSVLDEYLPFLNSKYGERIRINRYDLNYDANRRLLEAWEAEYACACDSPNSIRVFLGKICICGESEILSRLDKLLSAIFFPEDGQP